MRGPPYGELQDYVTLHRRSIYSQTVTAETDTLFIGTVPLHGTVLGPVHARECTLSSHLRACIPMVTCNTSVHAVQSYPWCVMLSV